MNFFKSKWYEGGFGGYPQNNEVVLSSNVRQSETLELVQFVKLDLNKLHLVWL
jgi:hypothetical protein